MTSTATLLLVEDEPLVCIALQDALEDAGYTVLAAENGEEGADTLTEHIQNISCLITDIRLGSGPDGWRLAEQARALRPELPVLYVSGDSAYHWAERGVSDSIMLQKPVAATRVLAALSEVMP